MININGSVYYVVSRSHSLDLSYEEFLSVFFSINVDKNESIVNNFFVENGLK